MRYDIVPDLKQDYEKYTPEDLDVWRTLYQRQITQLQQYATHEYLKGLDDIHFTPNEIPNIAKANKLLAQITGWELIAVPGILNEPAFFSLLAQKKFPATTWLRKKEQLDYLSEPDMFHDVFGHVPILTNYHFTEFFQTIGTLGVQYLHRSEIVTMLGRLYWFTVEFGLIRTNGNPRKIYGAGIISSYGETKFCMTEKPSFIDYNTELIMNTNYENDHIQDTYFVIHSFEQLYHSIDEIKRVIDKNTF